MKEGAENVKQRGMQRGRVEDRILLLKECHSLDGRNDQDRKREVSTNRLRSLLPFGSIDKIPPLPMITFSSLSKMLVLLELSKQSNIFSSDDEDEQLCYSYSWKESAETFPQRLWKRIKERKCIAMKNQLFPAATV